MNKLLKALGFVLSAFLYHAVQTSKHNRTISLAYELGVNDGRNIEHYNTAVKIRGGYYGR